LNIDNPEIPASKIPPPKYGLLGCPVDTRDSHQKYPYIANFGEYSTWIMTDRNQEVITGYSDNFLASPNNTYKVSSEGKILWNKSLDPLTERNSTKMISDNFGGVFIFYESDLSVFMQYVDSQGIATLPGDKGLEVISNTGDSGRILKYQVLADNSGGIYIIWDSAIKYETNSNWKKILRGQNFDRNGQKLWNAEGNILTDIDISTMNEYPSLVPDADGGFTISLGTDGSRVWRVGADGKLLWVKRF
jgi:hypothetical protein